MVMVRGKVRLVSPRLLDRTSTLDAEDWHPVHVEGRGKWFTNVNLPSLHEHSIRVLGPESLLRLKRAAGPEGAAKLDRAPTLIVVSCMLGGDPPETVEAQQRLRPPPPPQPKLEPS